MSAAAPPRRDIVVVGASMAGFRAAAELRHLGFDGCIRIVGDEPVRTYERPPLSKGVLSGSEEPASIMWAEAADDGLDLDWHLGERAVELSTAAQRVQLASGGSLHYDGLVIACGATPRRLPGQPDLAGLHVLRSLDDCLGLRADLDAGPQRIAVVGAGFIGSEVAATCRERGHEVTLVEPLEQPLVRVLGPVVGAEAARMHREHGVDVRLGVGVVGVEGDGRVERVLLADGTHVRADVVVVGIGVRPNTDWLAGSGLRLDDGIVCDSTCLAAPGVVAAGDVARWDHPRYGSIRVEHWDNAVAMGLAAAARLLASDAEAVPFDPTPWFWSDQYDAKIQLTGRPGAADDFAVVAGTLAERKFVGLYGRDGRVTAALGWNWPAKVARYGAALSSPEGLSWSDAVA